MQMDRSIAQRMRKGFWGIAMAFLLVVLAIPVGAMAAQVSTPTAGDEQMYVDPSDRFAVPIPTNWIAEEQEGYVRIATSDGKITIFAAIVEAPGATSGIDMLLRLVDPEFENAALTELLATPEAGADESAFYTFDDGAESGQLVQALGRKVGDDVFVLALQGELESVKLRQIQVDKIFEGTLIRTESEATPAASPTA